MGSPATSARSVPWREGTLAAVVLAPLILVAMMHPVIRGAGFHVYADQRTTLGIPHIGDVLSNLPFVIVGLFGMWHARDITGLPRGLVLAFFASVACIGLGSGLYHLTPSDATLAVDWLPIALTASLMVALLVHDRIDPTLGWIVTAVATAASVGSIAWWWFTLDARWYGLVQLTSIALVPVIVILYPRGRLERGWLLAGVACFVLARLVHAQDRALLDASGVISGHTLKHLLAASATWCVLRSLPRPRVHS